MGSIKMSIQTQTQSSELSNIEKQKMLITAKEKSVGTLYIISVIFSFVLIGLLLWPFVFKKAKKIEKLRWELLDMMGEESSLNITVEKKWISISNSSK